LQVVFKVFAIVLSPCTSRNFSIATLVLLLLLLPLLLLLRM